MADDLALRVYRATARFASEERFGLQAQILSQWCVRNAVGRAGIRVVRVAVVALLAELAVDLAIATARAECAVLVASTVTAVVDPVVALLAEPAVDLAVPAIGDGHTACGATRTVDGLVYAVVALLV